MVVQFRRYVVFTLLDIGSIEALLTRRFLTTIVLCDLLRGVALVRQPVKALESAMRQFPLTLKSARVRGNKGI